METYSYFESAMDWLKVTSPIVAWIALFLSLIDTPGYKRGSLASPPLGGITAPNGADRQFTQRLCLR